MSATTGSRHGYDDLDGLSTEARLAAARDLDRLTTAEQVALVVAENQRALEAVAQARDAIATAVDEVAARLERGGRLVFVGAGTPGRLGMLDAVEVGPTFGATGRVVGITAGGHDAVTRASEVSEDEAEAGRRDLLDHAVGPDDAVVATSASGRTPYALAALRAAREVGASTIAVVNNPDTPMAADADVAIELLTGPEVVSGSTRMKAATAQKVVLNTLSTLAMVALGHTLGDLMVDVRATNDKLVRRAQRIIVEVTGADWERAARALAAADGEAKVAVVMVAADVDPGAARSLLAATGGRAREAIRRADDS